MNATTKSIIDRLPRKPLLSPRDVADAYGLRTSDPILADVKTGRLGANVVGGRYVISREAAEAYVAANEYQADEGTIWK